ncbi:diguanylate cyclase [Paucisalibacillus sp. EB02]|uniref:diguanylate cyclase n=1 Tax=Paucisalibacillus sp. EB02 TaxID=1347087 RepID=UPI0004B1979F|nr:diguanylate cyclase [Paucisalibacillus sp. EB02]
MEIINNRYRLKELLYQKKHVTVYLAFDMRNDNKVVLLNLLNSEYLPKSLIDFYVSRFIEIKGLTSNSIVRNYNFNTVSSIDNKLQSEPQYFYTSEYITGKKKLFDVTEKMNFKQLIDCFVEICTAVHYLHLKGFIHGALNRNAVFVNKRNEGFHILIEDVATVQMERKTHTEQVEDAAYKSPKVLAGRMEDAESDIYSLGVILLAMLTKHPSLDNPKEELTSFMTNTLDSDVLKVIPILNKLLDTDSDHTYTNLYDLIIELNEALETNYSIVRKEEFDGLNLHTKLVGRDAHIQNILRAYDKMISYQPGKRIFYVQGANGIGKTRFLQEVNFLLDLSKASVYASYSLNSISDDSKKMWVDILRELIMETNSQTVEKYNTELMKYFPELMDKNYATTMNYSNEQNTKYRLLNRIAGFISESIQDRPTAFIIDNIHLADDFTIDTFNYLCTEVLENTNLTLIFSCEDSDVSHNSVASDFIKNMKKRMDSETIRLDLLDEEQTGEMIQSILSISFPPRNISRRIYSQSYGNPLFITEIMKDLYSRQIIYVGEDTGRWQIDLPEESNYNTLDLPNSVEHALVNQLKDLHPVSLEILMTISIFPKPVSLRMMEEFLPTSEKLENSVEDLVKKGVLQRLIGDNSYLYDFRSKVLKNIVYDKIQPERRLAYHQLAASIVEDRIDVSHAMNLDDLIFQFVRSENHEKAKIYYLENAKKMQVARNTREQIENLKNALQHTMLPKERTGLYLEIGALLSDAGDFTVALEYLEEAERLATEDNHSRHKISAYVNLANAFVLLHYKEKVLEYIAKAEKEMLQSPNEEARLEIKRIQALLIVEENQILEAADMFLEIIEECGDRFNKIKGNTYRTLGFIYVHTGRADKALEAYHKSVNLLEEIDYSRGALLSLNNIGAVYAEIYEDLDKAMEYHLQVKHLSEEYGIFTSEVYALINIAESYLNKYDFDTAYDHFSHALTKAERYNMPMEKYMLLNFLTKVSLEMNNYPEALELYRQLKKDIKDNPNKGFDIGDYYETSAMLYQLLGNYEKADYYNQKTIQFHSEHENILKYTATVHVLINQLQHDNISEFLTSQILEISEKITNKSTNIESLCQAIHHLCEKGDYVLANRLITKVQQYIQEDTPKRLKAIYLHAKGTIEFHLNPNHTIGYLEESLDLAKKSRNKELIARIQADLGNAYYASKKYYEAANYYLESSEGIKFLISQIPNEYKLDYFNGRKFSKEFYRLSEIRGSISSLDLDEEFLPEEITSIEDLQALLHANQVDTFINNQEFMQYVSSQYMEKLSGRNFHIEDFFFQHLDTDVNRNLDSIGKFLSGKLLATKGYILAEEKGQELTVLSSIDGNFKAPENAAIFNRVRSTMKPVLLSKWANEEKGDHHFLLDELKGVMCIPIIKKLESQVYFGDSNQILGFIYLETDKIVNNFNEHGLEKCMEMVNFLVLLLEKRQLTITASIDKLTGTLTRKYLEDALQNTLDFSRKSGKEFSIIMFDLDKFKGVNDRYGHQIGDRILRDVSQIIIDHLDHTSMVGRFGGEEFIIVLPSVQLEDAKRIAESLRKTVQGQRLLGDKHEVTLSMGLASYPEQGQTVRELILKADQALYVAKENGRNNSQVWHKDFENKVKPANKLTGIVSGDEIRDARNVLALVELIQLTNKNLSIEDKLYHFLGRMIEIIEAQYGYILISDGQSIIDTFGRKSQEEDWVDKFTYNEEIVNTVITDRLGLYTIDWEESEKINTVNGLPDWDSIITVPIISNGWVKGVIYLSVPARLKEFGADELNVLNVYSELAANII